MVGGNLDDNNVEIYKKIVNLARRENCSKIGVISAANKKPDYWGTYYVNLLKRSLHKLEFHDKDYILKRRYGATHSLWIPVTEDDAYSPYNSTIIKSILNVTGIFFGGGEPGRLMKSLYRFDFGMKIATPAMNAIKTVWKRGALISGTSAGIEVFQDGVIIEGDEKM